MINISTAIVENNVMHACVILPEV